MTPAGKRTFDGIDLTVFGMVFLLGIFGILTIISSGSGLSEPSHLAVRQLRNFIIGTGVLVCAAKVPFTVYRRCTAVFAGISILLLLLLLLWGVRINGMTGWFRAGGLLLQPSEIAKAFYLLSLVNAVHRRGVRKQHYWAALGIAALWIIPIALQPDMGTAVIYGSAGIILLFLAGASWRNLAFTLVGAAAGAAVFIRHHAYALQRLYGFFNPDSDPLGSGWHVRQFELAIARGYLFGTKLGNAVWSNSYLPLPYNDSAFATLMETLGLAGALICGILWTVLIAAPAAAVIRRGIAPDARLFVMGALSLLTVQTLVHIAVNLCLLPPTGLTLPFISYGGSSFAGCGLLLGMALSALRDRQLQ